MIARRRTSLQAPGRSRLAGLAVIALAPLLLAPSPAGANDSTGVLAAGGLRLTVSPDIEMRSEDLYISRKRVQVDYRFFNRSTHDVRTLVAFPLPVVPFDEGDDANVDQPKAEPGNPWGFHASADGRPVQARLMRQPVLKGTDITAKLVALHLPPDPYSDAAVSALKRLPAAQRADLARQGLLRDDRPGWLLKSTYVWTQVFPAGREVAVRHVYTPSVGGSVETSIDRRDDREAVAAYVHDYCPDAAMTAAVVRFKVAHAGRAQSDEYVDYVLHTGANWAAPIGRFHLTLDKGDTKTLISVCLQGLRKTSPTRFELERRDFTPKGDLQVLFLRDE